MFFQFSQINKLINKAQNILLATHERPDGDGLGSMLAFELFLKKRNITSTSFCPDPFPLSLNFLPAWETVKSIIPLETYDLVIALDYGNFERLGIKKSLELKIRNGQLECITIDHHPFDNHLGAVRIVDPERSSTTEIVHRYLKETNGEIDKDIATCLLTGIFTDTGGFRHRSTSQETLEIAGQLLSEGASLSKIARNISSVNSDPCLKIWGRALTRIKRNLKTGMAFSFITQQDLRECKAMPEDLAGVAEIINSIPEAKFSLFLVEEEGCINGSLRSEEYKGIDVSQIARVLGGGGHRLASGFKTQRSVEEILSKINTMSIS